MVKLQLGKASIKVHFPLSKTNIQLTK